MRALKQTRSQDPTAPGILNLKNRKITVMGINPEGRGVQDAEFLATCGAKVTVTDTKNEKDLKESVARLKKYKNISFVLGEHRLRDFQNKDLIIRAAGAPLNSIYLKEAKKNGIEIKTDETLFLKFAPKITVVGVTGTRGKSTVTHLIYFILKNAKHRVFIAGNVRGQAALPLLKEVKEGDVVVMELDSWKLQGFGDAKISPDIAVFTTFYEDHMNYYKGNMKKYFSDKANIFKFQKNGDTLIAGKSAKDAIKKYYKGKIKSRTVIPKKDDALQLWKTHLLGEHNKENIAFAVSACRELGIPENDIKKGVEKFKGVSGRLELIKVSKGIKYYNDTTATSPEATIAALKALGVEKNVILIAGGADKKLNYRELAKTIPKFVKMLILFKGEASDKIIHELRSTNSCHSRESGNPGFIISDWIPSQAGNDRKMNFATHRNCELRITENITSMKEAVQTAQENAKKGDIILLSPAAASFGIFKNEFDRGEQFCELVG